MFRCKPLSRRAYLSIGCLANYLIILIDHKTHCHNANIWASLRRSGFEKRQKFRSKYKMTDMTTYASINTMNAVVNRWYNHLLDSHCWLKAFRGRCEIICCDAGIIDCGDNSLLALDCGRLNEKQTHSIYLIFLPKMTATVQPPQYWIVSTNPTAAILYALDQCIGQEHIIWLPLDLSKLFNIVEAAQLLSSWEERLDILSAFAFHSVYHSLTLIMSYLHSQ